jgi:hypothetical protein
VIGVGGVGCTDFDDLTRNVCGNGLLEAGEDCDSNDSSCVRCAISCESTADCPLDGGFACGVDGFCHAPGGELARPSAPVTFQADEMRVTDIDHDGRGDVVGVSRTSIVVRYGDPAGALSGGDSFVTPAQSGPASFGDLDGDGVLDVSLSTPDGIVTYTSPFGSLSPVDIETPLFDGMSGAPVNIKAILAIGRLQFVAFGVVNNVVFTLVFDFEDQADPPRTPAVQPCVGRLGNIAAANFDPARVDIYRVNAEGAAAKNTVLSFTTTTGAPCVLAVAGTTAASYAITDITPAGIAASLQHKPILADLEGDGDPCPGLVNSDGGPSGMRWWDGAMSGNRCSLAAAGPTGAALGAFQNAPANAVAIGRIPIVPAIPLIASDALVMTNGLYGQLLGSVPILMYQASRPMSKVSSGDLDGDGDIDAVVSAATEDDIDILYRYPEGVELLRFDTAANVTTMTIGDYDGNGINDIAYTEAAIAHQKMYVAYGTTDRHLPPLQVAAFADVATVTQFEFGSSSDQLSIADDLLVIQPAASGAAFATVTLLHGSPQRTMLSFLDPRLEANQDRSLLRGTIVGSFAGDARPDIMAIASPNPDQAALGMRAYRVAGMENGLDTAQSAGTIVDGLAECQQASTTGTCVQNARYLAWPRASGASDVVIAVDGRSPPRAMRIDPGQPGQAIAPLVADLPQGAAVQSLYAHDVDGDGTPELVAAFTGSVRICDVSADGMPSACEDVQPAIDAVTAGLTCVDAAPGRIGAPGLVVLCRNASTSTLFRVTKSGALAATELAQGVALRSLRVADVTGDGVDDVVAVQGDGSASALVVFPQCTTRDLGSCRSSAAAEGGAR